MTAAGAKAGDRGAQERASVDSAEIAKFSAMADEWWEPKGKFRPLHRLNPTRLSFVLEERLHFLVNVRLVGVEVSLLTV